MHPKPKHTRAQELQPGQRFRALSPSTGGFHVYQVRKIEAARDEAVLIFTDCESLWLKGKYPVQVLPQVKQKTK